MELFKPNKSNILSSLLEIFLIFMEADNFVLLSPC